MIFNWHARQDKVGGKRERGKSPVYLGKPNGQAENREQLLIGKRKEFRPVRLSLERRSGNGRD